MLPYAPLFEILLRKFGKPIVATSGNISGDPIVFEDDKALSKLSLVAEYTLIHARKIVIPQDDSVVRFCPQSKRKIVLRRSRGLAPTYINPKLNISKQNILCTGAQLKSSFSITHQGNIYLSQYLGNLENYETYVSYLKTLNHFEDLFQFKPEMIICDSHPTYDSAILAKELASNHSIPLLSVQHHQAHFASVLGEHNLLDSTSPILGVMWDGTGMGDDGQIWGGEIF